MTTTRTAGQQLTATLRKIKRINSRTRFTRDGESVKTAILDAIRNEYLYPGYYQGETAAALRSGVAVLHAWDKFVEGYRIDGTLAYRLSCMTPYEFTAYLGRMVDAGITNNGEAERFFATERAAA